MTGEKEVFFTNIVVNDRDFDQKLDAALKSDAPILQDTEKGYRYLEKQEDGTRAIRWEEKTGKLAAVAGAYYDDSLDYPLPFAGVNYFDYNFKKKNIQVNMFLAGPVNSLSISKSDFLPRMDAALSGVFFLVPFKDQYFENGIERKDQELKSMSQHLFRERRLQDDRVLQAEADPRRAVHEILRHRRDRRRVRSPEIPF